MNENRSARIDKVLDKRQPDLTVILENVFDPHNIAAVMRTCDSVGIQEIYILQSQERVKKKWGYRSSSGALKWLNVHEFFSLKSCIDEVRKKYTKIYSTAIGEHSKNLFDVDFTESIALVFGNEHDGVSAEMLELSDGIIEIPQVGISVSLNISVACAVTLYEAFRQKKLAGHFDSPKLSENRRLELRASWGDFNALQKIKGHSGDK